MAMKQGKLKKRFRRKLRKVISGGTTRLIKPSIDNADHSGQLRSIPDEGLLRLKAETLRMPSALADVSENSQADQDWIRPGRVMLTISGLAVVFIAVITWFISKLPAK